MSETVGSALSTVTETFAEVRVLPAASRATALSVCVPFESVVVFSDSEYGLEVSAEPTLSPSTRNCTFCTADVVGGGRGDRDRAGDAGSPPRAR